MNPINNDYWVGGGGCGGSGRQRQTHRRRCGMAVSGCLPFPKNLKKLKTEQSPFQLSSRAVRAVSAQTLVRDRQQQRLKSRLGQRTVHEISTW